MKESAGPQFSQGYKRLSFAFLGFGRSLPIACTSDRSEFQANSGRRWATATYARSGLVLCSGKKQRKKIRKGRKAIADMGK